MSDRAFTTRCFHKEVLAAVLNEENGKLMEYCHLVRNPKYRKTWQQSYGNEVRRLTQGMPSRVEGTNTLFFVHKTDVPAQRRRDITYGRIVVSYRPSKDDRTGHA